MVTILNTFVVFTGKEEGEISPEKKSNSLSDLRQTL